ncbi:hypothetical protein HYU14_04865 [Candidatus Woesearchaeota archaeon]|nr:hypothetical protein [Candidatus Woesearchaeota archaeon]
MAIIPLGFITDHFFLSFGLFLASAIPLYAALKASGAEAGMIKVFLVSALMSLFTLASLKFISPAAGIITIILSIAAYKYAFRTDGLRAAIAGLLQYIFIAIVVTLVAWS